MPYLNDTRRTITLNFQPAEYAAVAEQALAAGYPTPGAYAKALVLDPPALTSLVAASDPAVPAKAVAKDAAKLAAAEARAKKWEVRAKQAEQALATTQQALAAAEYAVAHPPEQFTEAHRQAFELLRR
ncbi:hypothetical protein ACFP2F_21770 [Hymenobacter artigasi]|uniref:PRTRC system protein E n=1 Tax=Hymenobacter artigasi TaxID=2719616 RepID=A0ABX1HNS4_9BACT|nr:hypothetical protein [Hymenobacter artigasi]NKI91876.1 hypothetical protein [Hymenobacter artigasi]